MFDFQKLDVYKKAKTLHIEAKTIMEKNNLDKVSSNQLMRASLSISINIAEGSGRFSKADRRNFYVIGRSSIFECVSILEIAMDTGQISEGDYRGFEVKADEVSRILFSMVKNLVAKQEEPISL